MKKLAVKYLAFLLLTFFAFGCNSQKNTDSDGENHHERGDNDKGHDGEDADWDVLFDGSSIDDNWRGFLRDDVPPSWTIDENGNLFFDPVKGERNNLVSKKQYGSFDLELEWMASEGGNSGVFWGVLEEERFGEPYATGPEIQILDDANHPDAQAGGGTHKAGALYDMIAPYENVVNPFGNWNHLRIRIDHEANVGEAWLNDTTVAKWPLKGEEWDAMVAGSKFNGWDGFGNNNPGYLSLQDHHDKVWYRNIRIRNL